MKQNDFNTTIKSASTGSTERKAKKKKQVGVKPARICDHTEALDVLHEAQEQLALMFAQVGPKLEIVSRILFDPQEKRGAGRD